jgi:hypothetical protein
MRAAALLAATLATHMASANADGPKAPVMGTVIVQENDVAIGLLLAPWKDETTPARGRPPGLHVVPPQIADVAADQARTAALATVESYQRARRQSLR